jgi:hypothetical protein
VTDLGHTKLALRFVYIPSFHTWSVVHVEIGTPDGGIYPEGTLTVRSETEDSEPKIRALHEVDANALFVRSFKLRLDEVWLILRTINIPDAFALPNTRPQSDGSVDGTDYVAEISESTRYHWALLGCQQSQDSREDSLDQLASLLGLIVRAHVGQELQGFPGD